MNSVLFDRGPLFIGRMEEIPTRRDGRPQPRVDLGWQGPCEAGDVAYRTLLVTLRRKLIVVIVRLWPMTEQRYERQTEAARRRSGE